MTSTNNDHPAASNLSMQGAAIDADDVMIINKIENKINDNEITEIDCNYYFVWFLFFIIGTFNNFGYVVVLSAAKSLADCFDEANLIGIESWALIGVGFIFKSVNAFYLEGISHRIRGYIAGFGFLIGYFLLSISVYIDFWFAIFSILFIGAACSFGESVILGYCKLFPAKMSGAWSSGTGMAGLAGAGLYLLLAEILGFSNQSIFITMIPSSLIYIVCIEVSWRSNVRKTWKKPVKISTDIAKNQLLVNQNELKENTESQWKQIERCFYMTWYRNLMLLLVYVFEYVCSVGLAQIANTNRSTHRQDFDYVILATCYQFGVFLSRSSVSIIELPYFGTMTFLQFINVIIWCLQAQYDILHYESIQFILMIYVGLLGGAMYVNVAYNILSDKTINDKDKELCVNFMALAVNVGITMSAVVELIMDNTIFETLVNKSSSGDSSSKGCSTL